MYPYMIENLLRDYMWLHFCIVACKVVSSLKNIAICVNRM